MKIYPHPSPNFNDRATGKKIDLLVIHYTGMKSADAALKKLSDPDDKKPVSAHYLIDKRGRVYQLVDENKRAWHAGVSFWHGETDINSRSIGIELFNSGKEPFTKAQMKSLETLARDIMKRHKIPQHRVVGHSDIAANRKSDPGPYFDWKYMAKKKIGVWPKPTLTSRFNASAIARDYYRLADLFHQAGYQVNNQWYSKNQGPTLKETILAFQQRYQPELFRSKKQKHRDQIGHPNPKMVRQLKALLTKKP